MITIVIITSIILTIIILFIMVPVRGFFKDIPKDLSRRGTFRPYTYKRWQICTGSRKYSKRKYHKVLHAYLVARYMAWVLDLETLGDECGIFWGIVEVSE